MGWDDIKSPQQIAAEKLRRKIEKESLYETMMEMGVSEQDLC